MPLPSLYVSGDKPQAWSIKRAAICGAALGTLAALFKIFGPLHEAIAVSDRSSLLANIATIAVAAAGFASLCAGATALRNLIARRLIWPELR
jgi:hypothetical protein